MRCDKIVELLSPYLDHMTNEKESRYVEAHIVLCSSCRNELEQLKRICNAVHKLDVPEVPETFLKDFHQRLINENLKYFGQKHIRTAKKPGWIAASVAGLAIAAGIYASSFLPFDDIVASLQNRMDKSKQPSSVAIDNILDNVKGQLAEKSDSTSVDKNKPETIASTVQKGTAPDKTTQSVKPGNTAVSPVNPNTLPQQPAVTNVVTTSVKVADIGSSVQKVMEIAGENGGQYTALPASAGIQAFSSTRTKAVSIKVDPEISDKVITELKNVGVAAEPEYDKVDVTTQVKEVQSNISDIQTQIAKLEANSDENAADKAKLDELNNQLFQCNQKKDLLNRTVINIYLVEESQ